MLIRKLLHIFFVLIFCFYLFACTTSSAHKYAKEKASEPITYSEIVDVYPVAVREGGNIKICVMLKCQSDNCKEHYYLVSLPFNSLASGKIRPEKMDLQKEVISPAPHLPIFFFPMKMPSKECAEISGKNNSTESQISIEKLFLPVSDWPSLYKVLEKNKEDIFALLKKYNDIAPSNDTLYSINIVYEDLEFASTLLIYLPDNDIDLNAHAIGIVGGYKDKSTKGAYALIPFAIIGDALIFFEHLVDAWKEGSMEFY